MAGSINLDESIGITYSQLTIVSFSHFKPYKSSRAPIFNCICTCGKYKEVCLWDLKSNKTTSCGCSRIIKSKEMNDDTARKKLYITYNRGAQTRGYDFFLTKEEFNSLIVMNCFYCNSTLSNNMLNQYTKAEFKYNGIDRKDNSLGYILENCVPCCRICNRAKSDMPYDEFKNWVTRLASNLHNI